MAENIEREHIPPEAALSVLEATPGIHRALLAPLPPAWLAFREDTEAWSPRTVLVHFIQNERTNWIPRARVILSPGAVRQFAPFQQLPAAGALDDTDVAALLDEFARLRQENLATLRAFNLTPDDYGRTAEHPALGTVTLAQLLATWVVHDLNHTHQVLKTLAKLQVTAVGPWRPYLALLDL